MLYDINPCLTPPLSLSHSLSRLGVATRFAFAIAMGVKVMCHFQMEQDIVVEDTVMTLKAFMDTKSPLVCAFG